MVKNERGVALVIALIMTLLVSIIGVTAIKMSEVGFITFGSEKKYQVAKEAAEYALNAAVNYVITNAGCPSSNATIGTVLGTNAAYSYFAISSDSGGNYCFINGKGTYGGATVVRVAVVPKYVTDYGALTFRKGGSVYVGGSSNVVSCDSTCKTPGIAYGTSINLCGNSNCNNAPDIATSVVCPNKGINGLPAAVQDTNGNTCTSKTCTGSTMSDRIPMVFNSDNWTDMQTSLGNIALNQHKIDVANLGISDWDTGTGGTQAMPATSDPVDSSCTCNCAVVLAPTTNNCCTGAGADARTNINSCASLKVTGTIDITGSGTYTGKTIYATGSITVNNSGAILNNTNLIAGGALNIISASAIQSNSALIAEGTGGISLTSASGVTNSTVVTTNPTATITLNDSAISNSTLITKGNFNFNTDTKSVTDSSIFANTMTITKAGSSNSIQGGLLYSAGIMDFTSTISQLSIGTESKPVMMLAGGNIEMDHMTGQAAIYGLVFTNGAFITDKSNTGQFSIQGAIIANGDAPSTYGSKGNATINFNKTVLDNLSGPASTFSGFMKAPPCGKGGRGAFLASNKITVY